MPGLPPFEERCLYEVIVSESYESHEFHAPDRDWPETNCYVDVLIEILHSAGVEVPALFSFTLSNDFEGDQWTFFKPPHSDLHRLYGIEIEELLIWKDLETHLSTQVDRGRIPLVEADSFYLPDTEGRDYGVSHTKTTIGVEAIDPGRSFLRYFHNRARHELSGANYRALLRLEPAPPASDLMPYCEFAKLDRLIRHDRDTLRAISLELARDHLARRPETNPIERYAATFEADAQALIGSNPDDYDLYAFATVRQCGSGFALTADYLRWLSDSGIPANQAADCFETLSSLASILVMKMARIVHSGQMRDLSKSFDKMAEAWERGMAEVDRALGA